ncbi:hypothetical protein JCM8097_005020 [Rhodosporidiobolus ruineniae]
MDGSTPPVDAPSTAGSSSRVAAVAMLKRAASTREAAASPSPSRSNSPRTRSPALSRSASSATPTATTRHRSRTISSANPAHTDEDTSLFLTPAGDSASNLERTASLLARQLALAKLTGTAPPTPPPTFFTPDEPLPTLAELQQRARAKFAREHEQPAPTAPPLLHRNNTVAAPAGLAVTAASVLGNLRRTRTVTGVGTTGLDAAEQPPPEREQARVNLMRKLSARRLDPTAAAEQKDRLGVVGRIGRARPRSGSISALDWRAGGPSPDDEPPVPPRAAPTAAAPDQPALAPPIASSAHDYLHLGASLEPLRIPDLPSSSSTFSPSNGIGIGIAFASPASAGTDRSSGGNWAAERDRQSVLARARGEGAWEFDEVIASRAGGGERDETAEVLRDSQLPEDRTPRPSRGPGRQDDDEDRFATPSTLHASTLSPHVNLDGDVSPRTSPNPLTSEWQPAVPALGPPRLGAETYRSGAASGSSSSNASTATTPSPGLHPDPSARRLPFLPTFGIAAVEEPVRKRGSSASSSIAGQLLDSRRMRGSDAFGGFGGAGPGMLGRNSVVSSTSTSVSEGDEDEQDEVDEDEDEEEELRDDLERAPEERTLGAKEQRLVDKVEKKREAAQARAKSPEAIQGAFPPPQDDYQFPSPRHSRDGGPSVVVAPPSDQQQQQDPHRLFQQLSGASSAPSIPAIASPASPGRKGRDFPFKLPFQQFQPFGNELPVSPILPDPISPTSVIPDPMSTLVLPPHSSPRVSGLSPAPTNKARFSSGADAGGVGMKRSESTQSRRSQAMEKSPSTESEASFRSAGASSYHSPVAMRRDLSSSSRSSEFSFSPRVPQLPAEHLPSNRILAKLDSFIGDADAVDPTEPSPLDAPPRKLLLHGAVLQVVNANTVKDRYLFLFTDLLVIAKPLVEDHPLTGEPIQPTLDSQFVVKSVVEFKHLKLAAAEEPAEEGGSSSSKKRHPLLVAFVDRFANDPSRAIASLVQKGGLANDGPTIANLLFRNTDLNRNQLGAYLANPQHRHVLRAYIERFRFQGVRVDDALRLFCMSVRLPHDVQQAEYVLGVLAGIWTESNASTGFDPSLTFNLVTAILRLTDALHGVHDPSGGSNFFPQPATPSPPPSVDDFIGTFREHDTRMVVPEDLLARIYTSVRRERIEQASDNSIFSMAPDIEAVIEPAKLPTRLTYRSPSDVFTITIPEPDPKFTVKLHGNDLQFDPPVLSFARSNKQSFRVTGNALGVRVMVLLKRGANAPRYQGLPLNKAFSIERGFMQHTFQVSFTNHLDLKRKYMFSTVDGPSRAQWLRQLRDRIVNALDTPRPADRALAAAQAVSVQVLRDVFLPPDEPVLAVPSAAPSPRPNLAAPRFGPPVTPAAPPRTAGTRLGTPTRPGTQLARSNSVSKLYGAQFKHEADLGGSAVERRNGSLVAANLGAALGRGAAGAGANGANKDKDAAALQAAGPYVKNGRELVLTTEQNSLLPTVLAFLNTGLEAAPLPVSLQGSAFQLPPLPPSSTTSQPQHPALSFASFLSSGASS